MGFISYEHHRKWKLIPPEWFASIMQPELISSPLLSRQGLGSSFYYIESHLIFIISSLRVDLLISFLDKYLFSTYNAQVTMLAVRHSGWHMSTPHLPCCWNA